MKIVLDTNVVLDWLHFQDAGVELLARAITEASVQLVTSGECLQELQWVLARSRFGLDAKAQTALFQRYLAQTSLCEEEAAADQIRLPVCRDPDDQKFLQLALSAGARYLLTKDRALLRLSSRTARLAGFAVMTPARFASEVLQVLQVSESSARR
jgi:putative PIN family toxin of toxin-antitoxin system